MGGGISDTEEQQSPANGCFARKHRQRRRVEATTASVQGGGGPCETLRYGER